MIDADDIQILIPAHDELALVGLTDLLEKIRHGNYQTLEEAVDDAAIDTVELPHPERPHDVEYMNAHLRRIAQLNLTGDADAYWNH